MFSRVLYYIVNFEICCFRALFAITQLLCHVSSLLTRACKQAPVNKHNYYVSACNILWHDVFACTSLDRELRDYNLGQQIAFAVFERYLLSHSYFAM